MSENGHFCAPPCVKDKNSNRMSLSIAPKTGHKSAQQAQPRPGGGTATVVEVTT